MQSAKLKYEERQEPPRKRDMSTNLSETQHGRKRTPPLKRGRKVSAKISTTSYRSSEGCMKTEEPLGIKDIRGVSTQWKYFLQGSHQGHMEKKETGWETKEIFPRPGQGEQQLL